MNLENNVFKGIWIPFQILNDKKLSDKEKFILCLICFKSKLYGSCNLSNRYLSDIFNISETQCSKLVNSLAKKNYITIQFLYENDSREVKKRTIKPKKFILEYMNSSIKQKFNTSSSKVKETLEDKFKNNKNYNKNNKYNSNTYYENNATYDSKLLESLYEN